jgi:cyclophilin family peptidyl-prolyl cis-trans isomerase/HEAT repeat protein
MRPGFPLVIALLGLHPAAERQAGRSQILEEILLVEDRRAQGENDLAILTGALAHADPLVVRHAARAIGRLERPGVAWNLFPLLLSPFPAVRSTAMEAIAQAAQGFRGDSSLERRGTTWPALLGALRNRIAVERNPEVRGMLALSLGRLPWYDRGEIESIRSDLVRACGENRGKGERAVSLCRGAETMVRATWRRVPLGETEQRPLRAAAREAGAGTRRHALGALLVSQTIDDTTLGIASRSADPELRRLALTGVRRLTGNWQSSVVLVRGLRDPDPGVRIEALRALGRAAGANGCSRLSGATTDPSTTVALVAIELLGACGRDTSVVRKLLSLAVQPSSRPGPHSWHRAAHALVALARASPAHAAALIPEMAAHPTWQPRMYAARAAAVARDTATLLLLVDDPSPNVREAVIAGLKEVRQHASDRHYRQALAAADYQLVLTAAAALAGTPDREAAATALLGALDRISLARAETSRDPRVAILVRVRETGSPALAARLVPYLEDFDPAIADSAAAILTAWTGIAQQSKPRPGRISPVTRTEVEAIRSTRLRVVMRTGKWFEVELLVEEAPVTAARIMRLVKRRYYDDLTFHRVVPNFVLQGGSPGANEYSGVPAFMRDELAATSHARGTLGVSTRGRDTGDGQIFINLRDNPRLDYDYTVWGRVVSGLETIDAIQEGDSILRVEIRSR